MTKLQILGIFLPINKYTQNAHITSNIHVYMHEMAHHLKSSTVSHKSEYTPELSKINLHML